MSNAPETQPVRSRIQSSDPTEARELVERMYESRLQVESISDDGFQVSIDQVSVGSVTLAEIELRASLRFQTDGRQAFGFGTMLGGTIEHRDHGESFGRGDVYMGVPPGPQESCRTDRARSRAVQLDPSLLDEAASAAPDTPPSDWRFLSRRPVDGGAAQWNGVVSIVGRLLADPRRASSALVVGPAIRLLAATALDVFPNSAIARPRPADAHDAQPSTVRRAMSFIEANPGLDITVGDIARAAYVSTRAVQLAFRRQLDTTPTAYLRGVRLSHARRELQEATGGDGVTVTRVALRWGFSTPSRFAEAYRAEYGETPRQTLDG